VSRANDSDLPKRAIPWNHSEFVSPGWYRRTWHIAFAGPADLSALTPSTSRVEYPDAMSHVLCVVTPEGGAGARLDVFTSYPRPTDTEAHAQARLEAETIAYDSLLLQRIVRCGPGPVTINGWEQHPVLGMAREPDDPADIPGH
jgi:hypothetical protein